MSEYVEIEEEESTLAIELKAISKYMNIPGTNDVHINKPGEVITQGSYGKKFHVAPEVTYDWCYGISRLIANHSYQNVDEEKPLLGATLPDGQRIQVVIPPATTPGCVAIAIRIPSPVFFTMDELEAQGGFDNVSINEDSLDEDEKKLLELKEQQKIKEFIQLAVKAKKTIICSGATSAGKTTYSKAFIECIPEDERLICIEDAPELEFRKHKDVVRLFYSRGEQGLAKVTVKELIEVVLRLNPDRVLLSELRGEEAFYFLRNVNSGHPGTITTVHANSPLLAFNQLALYVKESRAGANLSTEDIKSMLIASVDVILQFKYIPGVGRKVTGIYYDPVKQRQLITR
ncbi:P-type DNA transfer ATPase VirB11 [Salmonella bongori]|jgi:type IV secretion system protein VirB11|uniref:Type IV secretion system protein n=2 Tax=Salmonella enterica TaxID=28901 RepID=A0A5W3IV95_SALMU|nr:P-type DNA transfer ATPase VirB11 [Salmonella enterica subsp. enterica serovar Monschaui]EBW6611855.1 P-type DNA transfer ATPase VirB11 [Salmonella enterica subsp. enterica serovar Muenchen]ECB6235025.1 P-type DNA transfer ATPase VirB11 [Salmonella enterica subsp. enterica serovar Minnesota]ECC9598946.1 P-type DNA transfer ATPase VirB11 [Salmonella bongori]EEN5929011.1 P-type DNA transfer ATPase VirB11 [Salmonella enterica]EIM5291245.1 P-type DNA transfer ATPase VirB11 [Salmonella enterica 